MHPGGALTGRALILSGSLGHGHDVIAGVIAGSLERLSWRVQVLDCMTMLGPIGAKLGDRVFRRLTSMPGIYDGLHFGHLRRSSRITRFMDREATRRLVPALEEELEREPAELVVSAFATGASRAAKLTQSSRRPKTMVLCTDATLHRLWVREGIDLFLVTSSAAAATVRRYLPRANVAIVPPPVRDGFYAVVSQGAARRAAGIPDHVPCVLMMGGGWGLGPLGKVASGLTGAGMHVLAVAGRNVKLERDLRRRAEDDPLLHAFGYSDRIPELMAAADLVLTTPGATTCSEARVVGRPLVLLDVVPGHGRENLQHELEVGEADACGSDPTEVVDVVTAALERIERPVSVGARPPGEWDEAFGAALARIGLAPSRLFADPPLPAPSMASLVSLGGDPVVGPRGEA